MFPRTFKIAGIAYVVESHFDKVTENVFPQYNSVENSITWISIF